MVGRFGLDIGGEERTQREIAVIYKEVYEIHNQLLHINEKREKHQGPYQNQINYFKRQFFFTEDIVQRIFVLNQLIKIHEKRRHMISGSFYKNLKKSSRSK
ncbi:hypothetical protein J2T20_003918 [Paenibacillus wynnii]|nr:hypothetical protein [Paenibacillus wynnii]